MSAETDILIKRAAAELKTAGAREIYVFGSAAKGTADAASDLDLAVSGLPPSVFYRMGARVSDLIGRSVDLIDLDVNTPFTRYLRTENELVRVATRRAIFTFSGPPFRWRANSLAPQPRCLNSARPDGGINIRPAKAGACCAAGQISP